MLRWAGAGDVAGQLGVVRRVRPVEGEPQSDAVEASIRGDIDERQRMGVERRTGGEQQTSAGHDSSVSGGWA